MKKSPNQSSLPIRPLVTPRAWAFCWPAERPPTSWQVFNVGWRVVRKIYQEPYHENRGGHL